MAKYDPQTLHILYYRRARHVRALLVLVDFTRSPGHWGESEWVARPSAWLFFFLFYRGAA